jgi:sulfatase maturation enzyme AslB (radical SAM superfamily)
MAIPDWLLAGLDPRNMRIPEPVPYAAHYRRRYIERAEGPLLPVSGLNISERCHLNCSYCSFDIKPNGSLMSWDLFQAVVHSPQVYLVRNKEIQIGDGEPLIYFDKEHGKTLLDVLKVLICELGLAVSISTAGLMPPNRKLGLEVLRRLPELGERGRTNLQFFISFTHLREGISVEANDAAMLETLRLLEHHRVIMAPLLPPDVKCSPGDFYNLSEDLRVYMSRARYVVDIGRARTNNPEIKTKTLCREHPCEATEEAAPTFLIRANGDVTFDCVRAGYRGTSTGNVYENDAGQMFELHREFLSELANHTHKCSRRTDRCEMHRVWNRPFTAPRSEKPIVPRAALAVR